MLTGIPMTFDDGAVIFEQGAAAADMYLIRAGRVRIVRSGIEGPAVQLALLDEGDFFGEIALFDPGPRTATAIAVGTVQVEAIDRPTFLAALERDESVREIVAEMSQRIRSLATDGEITQL